MGSGIRQVLDWCSLNSMLLNNDKTVILNVAFSERKGFNDPVSYLSTDILLSENARFLGVTVDRMLTFSDNVSQIFSRCNSRLFFNETA